VKTGSIDMK